MKKIDIEKIMEEIRKEIKKKNYPTDLIKFEDVKYDEASVELLELDSIKFNSSNFKSDIVYLKNNKEVQAWRYYDANGLLGRLKVFFKKVIRKLTKFYVEPIVIDQNILNEKVCDALCQINAKHLEDQQKIKELEDRIKKLEKRMLEKNK